MEIRKIKAQTVCDTVKKLLPTATILSAKTLCAPLKPQGITKARL